MQFDGTKHKVRRGTRAALCDRWGIKVVEVHLAVLRAAETSPWTAAGRTRQAMSARSSCVPIPCPIERIRSAVGWTS